MPVYFPWSAYGMPELADVPWRKRPAALRRVAEREGRGWKVLRGLYKATLVGACVLTPALRGMPEPLRLSPFLVPAAFAFVEFNLSAARAVAALRRMKGWCVACGYDLRETPGRCPECGAGAGAVGGAVRSDAWD